MESLEMTAIYNAVSFVWFRLGSLVDFANDHVSLWIPVGYSIALTTVSLFRSAMGANHNDRGL